MLAISYVYLFQDLTNGAEATPIPVINEFNRDMPNKFTYVTQNRLHRNVTNFLSDHVVSMAGCDCTDDCYDRYECPCRRLTEAGYCYADTPREPFGYNYKRLDIAVGTGIFECNVNCKCSKKCANRVAQLPLAHHLELFKTKKCGWGVRCRNDLPSGTFICCYFGDLMTEEQAEQVAKNHGDCYLAQLNFIELADEMKHGYEAYAVTPPDSDCDSGKTVERPSANRPCSLESDDNSSAGNSTSTSGYEVNETILKVINYFPKVEPTNDTHPTRQLYGPKEMDYIIDGKRHGNIGRFFNVRVNYYYCPVVLCARFLCAIIDSFYFSSFHLNVFAHIFVIFNSYSNFDGVISIHAIQICFCKAFSSTHMTFAFRDWHCSHWKQ